MENKCPDVEMEMDMEMEMEVEMENRVSGQLFHKRWCKLTTPGKGNGDGNGNGNGSGNGKPCLGPTFPQSWVQADNSTFIQNK